jgi:hypothetical protein
MKILILAVTLLASISAASAGQTCVVRNGYMYCGDTYNDYNPNCVKQGSSFVCH